MVCTRLDAGYCKALAAPCPSPNFGKAAAKMAKAKVNAAKKIVKKAAKHHSKRRR